MTNTRTAAPSGLMIFAVFTALLGSLSFGLTFGYTSSAIPSMESEPSSQRIVEPHHEETKSWIKSIMIIGSMFGSLIGGPVANSIGRKTSLIVVNVPFFIGWLAIALAPEVIYILLGRLLTGFCNGFVCTVVPMYLVEIAPLHLRGLIGSTFQTTNIFGIFLSSLFGVFCNWRRLALVSALPCPVMFVLMCFTVESPAYLFNSKRSTVERPESKTNGDVTYITLQALRTASSDIQAELEELRAGSLDKTCGQISFRELIRQPAAYRAFFITIGIMFFQQFSGTSPLTLSLVEIFRLSHINLDSFLCSVIVNAISFVATVIASLITDKCGRKPLLLLSGLIHVISLSTLGLTFYLSDRDPSFGAKYGFIAMIALILFFIGFALGYGCLIWVVVSEYTIYEARGLINASGIFSLWTFAFLIVKSFDTLQATIKPYGAYWLLAFVSALGIPFVAFFVPETKGKTCEKIAQQFNSRLFLDVPWQRKT